MGGKSHKEVWEARLRHKIFMLMRGFTTYAEHNLLAFHVTEILTIFIFLGWLALYVVKESSKHQNIQTIKDAD